MYIVFNKNIINKNKYNKYDKDPILFLFYPIIINMIYVTLYRNSFFFFFF